MKNYIVSLGIGLNMFFQEYIDLTPPEFYRSWSIQYKENIRFINWLKGGLK